jgi:hypothetical protein
LRSFSTPISTPKLLTTSTTLKLLVSSNPLHPSSTPKPPILAKHLGLPSSTKKTFKPSTIQKAIAVFQPTTQNPRVFEQESVKSNVSVEKLLAAFFQSENLNISFSGTLTLKILPSNPNSEPISSGLQIQMLQSDQPMTDNLEVTEVPFAESLSLSTKVPPVVPESLEKKSVSQQRFEIAFISFFTVIWLDSNQDLIKQGFVNAFIYFRMYFVSKIHIKQCLRRLNVFCV